MLSVQRTFMNVPFIYRTIHSAKMGQKLKNIFIYDYKW